MALFKQLRGNRASLDAQPLTDGYAYFCVDDGTFHIDFKDGHGILQRKQINAKNAEMLGTHTADEFLLSTDIDAALAQAKESGEFDGADGVSVTHIWNGTTLIVTSASGTSSANLKGDKGDVGERGEQGIQGQKGDKGDTGDAGVGISNVKQTTTSTADDGNNIITVTLTNGTTSTFIVQNGSKGSSGSKGDRGDAGYTPVRGTDYWTEADKNEMKAYIRSYIEEVILGGEW